MKRGKNSYIFIASIIIIILIVTLALFIQKDLKFSDGSGSGSGSGSGDDRCEKDGATKCGDSCCLAGEHCDSVGLFGGGKICCADGSKGKSAFGKAYCDEGCNKDTESECGQTCCDKSTQECKLQAGGIVGTCIPKGGCTAEQTSCPATAPSACCNANQVCTSTTIGAPPLGTIIWGCSASSCSGETPDLCAGTGDAAGYSVCCPSGQCENRPGNGEPYCAP